MYLDELERFIKEGNYKNLKRREKKLAILRNSVMNHQESLGLKRMVWLEQRVVGTFCSVHTYEEDKRNLFDFLNRYGLLPLVLNISWDKLLPEEQKKLEQFSTPKQSYLRFSPKKLLWIDADELKGFETHVKQLDIIRQIEEWKRIRLFYDQELQRWDALRKSTIREMKEEIQRVELPSGSLNVVIPSPQLKIIDALGQLSEDSLVCAGRINYELVMEYAAKGFFKKSEINRFRQLKNITSRYILTNLEKDGWMHEFFLKKQLRLSRFSQESLWKS
ncbi:hypothetical protein LK13_09380 [Paenibacillus polymyxa]|uniref:hypothetical protein n=1 Tax=Paenibacillus polymyxa TaxID=1406 RepID=UPI0005804E8D|nr:hypothetical protein [Paenibacillus polymyxa]AIY08782.1 hypothetical protein LK13_09380 [Paenibacillus polymyxa]